MLEPERHQPEEHLIEKNKTQNERDNEKRSDRRISSRGQTAGERASGATIRGCADFDAEGVERQSTIGANRFSHDFFWGCTLHQRAEHRELSFNYFTRRVSIQGIDFHAHRLFSFLLYPRM